MAESQSAIQKAQSVSLAKSTATSGDTDGLSIPVDDRIANRSSENFGSLRRSQTHILVNSVPFELFLKRSRAHRRCMESTTAGSSPIASLFAVRHCE